MTTTPTPAHHARSGARSPSTRCGGGWASTPCSRPGHRAGQHAAPRPAPRYRGDRAGAVRAGRQPGARPLLEAGRRGLDHPRRAHRRAAPDLRRCLLPGDGLAPRRPRTARSGSVPAGGEPAQPRGRSAVLRHHLHLLRAGGPRRTRGPRRPRPPPPRQPRHPGRRQGRRQGRRRERRADEQGRVPDLRQVEGLPQRPPADRDRDGGHPGRDPGAGVVLARQHQRLRPDPPGQGRHAGLDPVADRVGRRPRRSPRRPTAATCARAITPTSSGRSCARTLRRSRPPCRGRAATPRSPTTCGSRR